MKRDHLDSSFFFILGGIALLAAILVFNEVSASNAQPTPKPAVTRCPEDAVRLVTPKDRVGACVAADDFASGTELRQAADAMTACQPVGTGVLEISREDVIGWCKR